MGLNCVCPKLLRVLIGTITVTEFMLFGSGFLFCPVEMDIPTYFDDYTFLRGVDVELKHWYPTEESIKDNELVKENVGVYLLYGTSISYPYDFETDIIADQGLGANGHIMNIAFNGTHVCTAVNQREGSITCETKENCSFQINIPTQKCEQKCWNVSASNGNFTQAMYTVNQEITSTDETIVVREYLEALVREPNPDSFPWTQPCYYRETPYIGNSPFNQYSSLDVCHTPGRICRVSISYPTSDSLPEYDVGCEDPEDESKSCSNRGCVDNPLVTFDNGTSMVYHKRCIHCCGSDFCNTLRKCIGSSCNFYGDDVDESDLQTIPPVRDVANLPSARWSLMFILLAVWLYFTSLNS